MTDRVEAVFENGVFRPLSPVALREGERVELAYEQPTPTPDPQSLARALDEIAALPLETDERFDPVDADQVLYGGEDAR